MPDFDVNGRFAMYLRRSRADEEEERRGAGETLTRHYNMLSELAQRMNVVIGSGAVYREIVSGDTIDERPEVQRLLSDVERHSWTGVFVADVDRLARGDTMDQGLIAQTFLYSGTLIITPYKIYDPADPMDRQFFETKLFFARYEYDQIKRRLQAGRVNAVKEGLYVCSIPVFGYIRQKLPDRKGYSLVPDPERAPIVRMVFDWYLHGMDGREVGTMLIAQRLNDMGVRTNRGMDWTDTRVLRMLKNPTYAGYVQWFQRSQVVRMESGKKVKTRETSEDKYIRIRALHEALISEDDFAEVQRLIGTRRKSPAKSKRGVANIFSGLVKCSVCGRAMIRQCNPKHPEFDILKCSTDHCATSGIYITVMETAVLDVLRRWVVDFDENSIPDEPQEGPSREASAALAEAARKELATLNGQLGRLRDLLEQGVYDVDTYLERQAELRRRIQSATDRLKALTSDNDISTEAAIRAELPKVRSVLEAYSAATSVAEKNTLLKSVIGRIIYKKMGKTPHGKTPQECLQIDVFPVMPHYQ